jgi:GTP-binding protein
LTVKILSSDYSASIGLSSQIPAELCGEIIFVGRSNSGKSSLLNALCGRRGLAKVGATPGKTRTINLFTLRCSVDGETREVPLVDVPGYGFAKRSKSEVAKWNRLLSDYFNRNGDIGCVVVVADCRRGCEEEEQWFLDRIAPEKLIIAATKTDKLTKNEQRLLTKKLAKEYSLTPEQIFPLSLVPRIVGIEALRERLLS